MGIIRSFFDKLTFKDYRTYVLDNQARLYHEIKSLQDQIFLSNPVLLMKGLQIHLPFFYVDHIQKQIYQEKNFYEINTLNFIRENYGQIKKIVEVGANIGNHTLYYCSQLNAYQIYCFEPNKINRSVLEKNIELNHLESKVTVFDVALGEKQGTGVEKSFSISNTGMNRIEIADDKNAGNISIKPMDEYGFENIDFIKIDVEGFEIPVLLGAKDTIMRNKPVVMIEVFENNIEFVDNYFLSMGYKLKHLTETYNRFYEPIIQK